MLGTLASALLVVFASLTVGQAALAVFGWRRFSALAPAVGLAALASVAGIAIRLPGHATTALVALAVTLLISGLFVWRVRPTGVGEVAPIAVLVLVIAFLAGLVPFAAEGRFGILGTGFNPDMQQHLLIADWLSDRQGPEPFFISDGYPVGPHGMAVALAKGLGTGLVQAFGGLTIAVAPLTALTALGALGRLPGLRRAAVALLTALAYLAAAFLAQGAFKETILALFLLAFAIGLAGLTRSRAGAPAGLIRRAMPLAMIVAGTVYVYSFPGLAWLAGTAALWGILELGRHGALSGAALGDVVRRAAPPTGAALLLVVLITAPEWGRMIDFADFRAFDPPGRGLGNLFDSLSPLEAFDVWPTGDYRLDPGEGAIPAALYYVGAALGAAALAWGLARRWVSGDRALPAALGAAAIVYAGAAAFGTPYTAAKGLALMAPMVAILAAGGLLEPGPAERRRPVGLTRLGLAAAFLIAAGGSSLLALTRAQVGPDSYTADLQGIRPAIEGQSVLVLVPRSLAEERGDEFVSWELRGSDRRIETAEAPSGEPPPRGFRFVVAEGADPPFAGLRESIVSGQWRLWERRE